MRIIFITIMLVGILSGCGKMIYVPVETVRTETNYRDRLLRDSIYVHDSISMREKGDTIWMERWHTRWRDRIQRDTIYENKTDSIAIPYPVEKKLSKWNQFKKDYFSFILIFVGAIAFISALFLSKNRR